MVLVLVWRDGGRAIGFLKTEASEVELRALLGIVRLIAEVKDALLELVFAEAAVDGVFERTREARDVFFCNDGCGWLGFDIDEMEGLLRTCSVEEMEEIEAFLRKCSVDEAGRSWDWLPEDLSTGRREAGRGIPDVRTGMEEGCCSMADAALADSVPAGTENVRMRASHGELSSSISNHKESAARCTII